MSADRELESWQSAWAAAPTPSLDVQQFVAAARRRHRRDTLVSVLVSLLGLAIYGALIALRPSKPLAVMGACGLAFLLVATVLMLVQRRGTWKPLNQSTQAFLELLRRRAERELAALRVSRWLVAVWVLLAGPLAVWAWQERRFSLEFLAGFVTAVVPLGAASWWWARRQRRRTLHELEQTRQLLGELERS